MKVLLKALIIILLFISLIISCKTNHTMQHLKYTPEDFDQIKLDINNNIEHSLTPFYPNFDIINKIGINLPKQIFIDKNKKDSLLIPVCGYYHVTSRRSLKYVEQNKLLIHIKKINNENWNIGEIVESPTNEHPSIPKGLEKANEIKQKRIEEAKLLSDSELNQGNGIGRAFNINLLKYIYLEIESGTYEIYTSTCGLESNHVQVEIIIED